MSEYIIATIEDEKKEIAKGDIKKIVYDWGDIDFLFDRYDSIVQRGEESITILLKNDDEIIANSIEGFL